MWLTLRQGHHDGAKPGGHAFGLGWLVALGMELANLALAVLRAAGYSCAAGCTWLALVAYLPLIPVRHIHLGITCKI